MRIKDFWRKNAIGSDSSVFNVFTFDFLFGNPNNALRHPKTLVINEKIALKYFDGENPVGKALLINDVPYQVDGVVKNFPPNSHFNFDIIAYNEYWEESWVNFNHHTYIVLPDNYPPEEFEAKLPDFFIRNYAAQYEKETGRNYEDYLAEGNDFFHFGIQPLSDVHLNTDILDNIQNKGNKKQIYLFTLIAIFILIMACINYINITTARATKRAREVAIRKVIGASKKQLVWQFLGESFLFIFISVIVALTLTELIVPNIRTITGLSFSTEYIHSLGFSIGLVILILLISFISGIYPALIISSVTPSKVLKGRFGSKPGQRFSRNLLVIIQFLISILMLIGMLSLNRQVNFLIDADLKFDKENIFIVKRAGILGKNAELFKQILLENPEIKVVCKTYSLPGDHFEPNTIPMEGGKESGYFYMTMWADEDYLKLIGVHIIEGRYFSKDILSNQNEVVINRAGVEAYNLMSAIGTRFPKEDNTHREVIGVTENFHISSLHHKMYPMMIGKLTASSLRYVAIKISDINKEKTIKYIEECWGKVTENQPFEYSYLDNDLEKLYNKEIIIGKLFSLFSILAIVIACLGIFGLVLSNTENRIKEIGIRKVLGSGQFKIISLISLQISKWIIISFIIACPIGYFFIKSWLQSFSYHINLSVFLFIFSGIIAYLIAILTTVFISLKASMANPSDSLRHE